MRISDWSSDVCSSDLAVREFSPDEDHALIVLTLDRLVGLGRSASDEFGQRNLTSLPTGHIETLELGRRRLLCSRHIGPDRNGIALRIDMRAPDYPTQIGRA